MSVFEQYLRSIILLLSVLRWVDGQERKVEVYSSLLFNVNVRRHFFFVISLHPVIKGF
jgi:hypothetical protein